MSAMYGRYVENGVIDLDQTMADLGLDDELLREKRERRTVRVHSSPEPGRLQDPEGR